jgi:hypothetical protein
MHHAILCDYLNKLKTEYLGNFRNFNFHSIVQDVFDVRNPCRRPGSHLHTNVPMYEDLYLGTRVTRLGKFSPIG